MARAQVRRVRLESMATNFMSTLVAAGAAERKWDKLLDPLLISS